MNKIYITSSNPNKVKAVKDVFTECEIEIIELHNNLAQPKSIEETLLCAKARCLETKLDNVIGLEAGVAIINDTSFLVNFGVLLTSNKLYQAGGTFIPLPDIIKDKIYNENMELKDAMQALVHDKNINIHTGTIGYLTNDLVTRYDIFYEICKLLKGQYEKERK